MVHEIHMSERRAFRGCRRRWDWSYREGYVPTIKSKHLDFGIAYHKALETFYNPTNWKASTVEFKLPSAILVFQDECEKHKQTYLDALGLTKLPEEVEEDYAQRLELGEGMLNYHANYVHPKFDGWFKPVAVEIGFQVPIMDPDYPDEPLRCMLPDKCGQSHAVGADVVYAGRVDMLVEDIRYGGYWIWDHKTAAQMATAKTEGFLDLDDQIGSYCWALTQELNIDVRGFIYAESRKDFPRPPKFLKKRMGGRSFSTATNQATSLDIFVPHVKKHDPVAFGEGAYELYIQFLESAEATQYHQRFNITKSAAELRNIGQGISLEAADMVDDNLRIYPSVGRFTCNSCAYREPCLNKFQDEDFVYNLDTNFTKTTRRYWMDQQTSSEKSNK